MDEEGSAFEIIFHKERSGFTTLLEMSLFLLFPEHKA